MNNICTTIKHCRISKSEKYIQLLAMKPVPLAGDFCDTREQALNAEKFPITFVVFEDSGLIQCLESIDQDRLYRKYKYDSSSIPPLVKHFTGLAGEITKKYGGENNIKFLELGSNSNPLLNQLPANWELTAVDPSDVALNAKKNPNITLFNDFFSREFVEKNGLIGKYRAISTSNSMSHCEGILSIIEGVHLALEDDGEFWVEVKDGETIMNGLDIFDQYCEHCALHTIHSLNRVMSKVGLAYQSHQILPFHGGLIRALYKKQKNVPIYELPPGYFENIKAKFAKMQELYDNLNEHPITKVLAESTNNVAYGASGRATNLLNFIPHVKFDYIVDESPAKIGKFIPGVGTPIVGRDVLEKETERKNCLVPASNFFSVITEKNKGCNVNWFKF